MQGQGPDPGGGGRRHDGIDEERPDNDPWAGTGPVWQKAVAADAHGRQGLSAGDATADDLASLFAAAPPHEGGAGHRRSTFAVVAMAAVAVALVAVAATAVLGEPGGSSAPDRLVTAGSVASPSAAAEPPPAGPVPSAAPVAAEPVDAAEPAEPGDSGEPGEPGESTEPGEPTEPGELGDPGGTGGDAVGRVAVQAVRAARTATPRHLLDAAAVRRAKLGDLTVVTVEAVAVHAQGGTWDAPQRLRFAVPVRSADAVTVGAPWPLPPPASGERALAWEAVADENRAAAVREALAASGFTDIADDEAAVVLSRSPDVPGVLRAQVRANAPGARAAEQHQLWFHDDQRPALLGAEGGRP